MPGLPELPELPASVGRSTTRCRNFFFFFQGFGPLVGLLLSFVARYAVTFLYPAN